MQWKDVDCHINCLDYGNSFSGIQTDCLWQTICVLERQLLISIMQKQHSSYSMSWSRNTDESCHSGVWLFHDNAPAGKSLVAQQALHDWICSTEPSCLQSRTGSHYLIRNLKYLLRGTWFTDDESLMIVVKAWFDSQKKNKKFYFQGKNSWEEKLKRCIDVAGEYVKNDIICDLMLIFYRQVAKIFDHPSCWLSNHVSTAIISDSSSINQVQRRRYFRFYVRK